MTEIKDKIVQDPSLKSHKDETIFSGNNDSDYEFGKAFYDLISLLSEVELDGNKD